MNKTKIDWADMTWNPVTGCAPISEGCQNCYAQRMSKRLAGRCGYSADEPFKVTLHPERLNEPLKWRKPRRVFVCSMGDLFHKDVPEEFIDLVFAIMALAPQHTFQVLTKRPERMVKYFSPEWRKDAIAEQMCDIDESSVRIETEYMGEAGEYDSFAFLKGVWPLPNVWLGVTAENQRCADERIPMLLQAPAVIRFVSIEPMLGSVDIIQSISKFFGEGYGVESRREWIESALSNFWVIIGAETGNRKDKVTPKKEWIDSIAEQCKSADIPLFMKESLRELMGEDFIQEFPWEVKS